MANQYSLSARQAVKKEMHRFKEGTAESASGHKVKNRQQAIAIGLSKARKKGAKIPNK